MRATSAAGTLLLCVQPETWCGGRCVSPRTGSTHRLCLDVPNDHPGAELTWSPNCWHILLAAGVQPWRAELASQLANSVKPAAFD